MPDTSGRVVGTMDTRQARRAARRKAEILEAAANVFAENGFHRSTIKDIAEAADIAEGTIYNYFESKDDLLISLIDWLADLEKRREMYAQLLDVDFRQAFRSFLLQRLSVIREYNTLLMAVLPEVIIVPHLRELYRQKVMMPAIYDLEAHLRARVERGQIEKVDVPMVIRLLTALGLGLEVLMLMGDTETLSLWKDPDRAIDLITRATFDGILHIPAQSPESPGTATEGELFSGPGSRP